MVALTRDELFKLWEKYLADLKTEEDRANDILDILEKLPRGVQIAPPPLIDFGGLVDGGAKVKVVKPDPEARAQYRSWADEIMTILKNADPRHPLLRVREIQDIFHTKSAIDTRDRGLIASSCGNLFKSRKCGKTADSNGVVLYGTPDLFDADLVTIKAEYRGFLYAPPPEVEFLGRVETPEPPPLPPVPKKPEILAKETLDQWLWTPEVLKFLETYDATKDGLLSSSQILDIFAARYTNVDIHDKKSPGLLQAHLKNLFDNAKIGRIKVTVPKKATGGRSEVFVWGHVKYFDKEGSYYSQLKPAFDYMALYLETKPPR